MNSSAILDDAVFVGNTAMEGGAIYSEQSEVYMTNLTFVSNTSNGGCEKLYLMCWVREHTYIQNGMEMSQKRRFYLFEHFFSFFRTSKFGVQQC